MSLSESRPLGSPQAVELEQLAHDRLIEIQRLRKLTPEIAAVAATLVDLAKRDLPPHVTEAQQVEAYLALRRIAEDQ